MNWITSSVIITDDIFRLSLGFLSRLLTNCLVLSCRWLCVLSIYLSNIIVQKIRIFFPTPPPNFWHLYYSFITIISAVPYIIYYFYVYSQIYHLSKELHRNNHPSLAKTSTNTVRFQFSNKSKADVVNSARLDILPSDNQRMG